MPRKPILALDFDGCCSDYRSGWQSIDQCPDPPVPGLEAFLREAMQHFDVHIHSSRSSSIVGRQAMGLWFATWFPPDILESLTFPEHKPPAMVTLDDRAVTFLGFWPDVQMLLAFQPWTRNTAPPHERPPSMADTGFAEPGGLPVRAGQWVAALEILDAQIRALPHEPDIQHALYVLWEIVTQLRRGEAGRKDSPHADAP